MKNMPFGKLKPRALERLLAGVKPPDGAGVLLGPSLGEDAAVLRVGKRLVVVATDPVTFVTDEIGHYAVTVNANDIACLGARPRWLQVCLLLPPMSEKRIKRLFDSIANSAAAQGIAVTGGHTEITVGLDRPIVVGTMLGEVSLENLVRPSGARKGDLLLMIKPVAIEGTSILAREKSRELSRRFGRAFVKRCAGFLHEPGISVVRPALAAARAGAHALHDPTEGGLLTGAYEIARASRVGLLLDADAAQILPETRKIADFFSIDPLGLIASGTLLAAFDEPSARRFLRRANALGGAWVIGRFEGKKILVKRDGKIHRLEPSGKDEILKAL